VTAQRSPDDKDSSHFLAPNQNSSQEPQTRSPESSSKGRTVVFCDAELKRLITEALRQTREPALVELQVSTRLGVVTLHGQVPHKDLKILAISTAMSVGGAWVLNCGEVSVCPS
jgi:osmotically-inducible protein OsmY